MQPQDQAPRERYSRIVRGLQLLLVVLTLFFVLLFLYAAIRRMRYPFEVEWIESGILVSVLRILHGQSLYVAPSISYVPYLYAPLYLYLAAGLTKLIGIAHGYLAMRLLSTLATLGSCVTIYALVMQETRRRIAGVAAIGLFIAGYAVLDSFYDIGRVDSLFVLLLLLALLAQRRGYPVIAALIWVLVFQTKQTALPLAVFILCADWQRPRRVITGIATYLVVAGASILLLNHATGGWYSFYIFHVAGGLGIQWRQVALYIPSEILAPVTVAWVIVFAALLLTRPRLSRIMLYLFVSMALFGALWFVAAHKGASMNAIMPCYAWTAVLFGVSVARLLDWAEERKAQLATILVLGAVALQLMALTYNPGRFIPPASAAVAGWKFVDELRAIPGDVYVLNHTYDAILAGKKPHAEGEALGAVLDAKMGTVSSGLRAQLDAALASHQYTAVVSDSPTPSDTAFGLETEYPFAIETPLTGLRYFTSQPQWFLLPCDAAPSVQRALLQVNSETVTDSCSITLSKAKPGL